MSASSSPTVRIVEGASFGHATWASWAAAIEAGEVAVVDPREELIGVAQQPLHVLSGVEPLPLRLDPRVLGGLDHVHTWCAFDADTYLLTHNETGLVLGCIEATFCK